MEKLYGLLEKKIELVKQVRNIFYNWKCNSMIYRHKMCLEYAKMVSLSRNTCAFSMPLERILANLIDCF